MARVPLASPQEQIDGMDRWFRAVDVVDTIVLGVSNPDIGCGPPMHRTVVFTTLARVGEMWGSRVMARIDSDEHVLPPRTQP